jgi:hypothetical protein
MANLTREQVIRVLGDVDDHTIARIISTGADEARLVEASRRVEHEAALGEPTPQPGSAVVDELCAVLYELGEDDVLDSGYD